MTAPTPRHRRGRILYSILALLLTVGVAPLVWTSWQLVARSRQTVESNQKEWQLDKARLISTQIAIYVDSLRKQVVSIARTFAMGAGGAEKFADRLARIQADRSLESYLRDQSTNLVFLSVVDVSGNGTQSGLSLQDPRLLEQLREAFQRGQNGDPMISVPIVSRSIQEPLVVLEQPVVAADRVVGVVLAVASLQPIREITNLSGGNGAFEVYVVDNRGHLIAHSDKDRTLSEDLSKVEIVRDYLAQLEKLTAQSATEAGARPQRANAAFGTMRFNLTDADGKVRHMLGTYMPVPDGSGWCVVVQNDIERAYFDANDLRKRALLLVIVVTGLAVVFGSLLAGQITSPVRTLAESARRMAGGEYATRVSVRSRNEVGFLADAFNYMGEEIQKAIEEIKRRAEENKELFMGSIRMLANAIDEKDPYTRGHSERVAYYSACIAKHLGMSPEDVERVHLSGIIHDVGKIGIEDKILRKAAALTDDEYEIMKQHPTKGEHILDAVPLLKEKAGEGLMHHENVDGTGYPRGLRGDDIPLMGRIVSVADAFDAMTTDRPYSKAMTFEAAIARLRFLADKKFDRPCVDAFERAFLTGDLSPAKARRASVASRYFDIKELVGEIPPPSPAGPVPATSATDVSPMSLRASRPALVVLLALSLAAAPRPAAAQSSADAEQRFSTGIMHLREGRADLALEELKKAVKEDPKSPYFQKGLGLAYAAKREWKDAIACFRKALELNPYYVDVHNDLGAALIGSGDREGGRSEFLSAYSDPTNPTPEISARNLGEAYLEEKNYDQAAVWFKTSLSRNKGYPAAYIGLAQTLVATGRLDEAIATLEQGLQEVPGDADLLLSLGQACAKGGRFAEARSHLEEALQKDPAGPAGRTAAEQLKTLPR
jgi:HD-GYP domain-containing protein (c-di-GMP phosphodiesterase class II)/Tfp pilus assembly protein PilF